MEVVSRVVLQLTTTGDSSTTDHKQERIAEEPLSKILFTTVASLSILGSLIIVCTFLLWPDLRTNSRLMIVFISVCDLLVASFNILGIHIEKKSYPEICKLQATVNIAAVLSSFFWTVHLSIYFYLTICKKITVRTERVTLWLFHISAWGIPVVIAAAGYGLQAVGNSHDMVSSGWCWIEHRDKRQREMILWMLIAGKGWEMLAYVAISVFYVLVKVQIRRELKCGFAPGSQFLTLRSVQAAKKADLKLTFIPVVFIFLRIWGTIRFIYFWALNTKPPAHEWLIILQGIGDNSQGFADFVLFCLFTDKIRNKFRQLIPFCRHNPQQDPFLRSANLCYGAVD